jgi:hypothetical protein
MTEDDKKERIELMLRLMDKRELAEHALEYQIQATIANSKLKDLEFELEQLKEGFARRENNGED